MGATVSSHDADTTPTTRACRRAPHFVRRPRRLAHIRRVVEVTRDNLASNDLEYITQRPRIAVDANTHPSRTNMSTSKRSGEEMTGRQKKKQKTAAARTIAVQPAATFKSALVAQNAVAGSSKGVVRFEGRSVQRQRTQSPSSHSLSTPQFYRCREIHRGTPNLP